MIPLPPPAPLKWEEIVKLAHVIDRAYRVHGTVDVEHGFGLARAILTFQEQLVGGLSRRSP